MTENEKKLQKLIAEWRSLDHLHTNSREQEALMAEIRQMEKVVAKEKAAQK